MKFVIGYVSDSFFNPNPKNVDCFWFNFSKKDGFTNEGVFYIYEDQIAYLKDQFEKLNIENILLKCVVKTIDEFIPTYEIQNNTENIVVGPRNDDL